METSLHAPQMCGNCACCTAWKAHHDDLLHRVVNAKLALDHFNYFIPRNRHVALERIKLVVRSFNRALRGELVDEWEPVE
jgi:hypothetical protein